MPAENWDRTNWSGRGDSNPRLQLGKLSYYPYTTAARIKITYSMPLEHRQLLPSPRSNASAHRENAITPSPLFPTPTSQTSPSETKDVPPAVPAY